MRMAVVGAAFANLLFLSRAFAAEPAVAASKMTGTVMPVLANVMPDTPSGAGDPDTVVCRAPQRAEGSGQPGPQVCRQNSEWWKLAMTGKDLAPDGRTEIDRPTVASPTGEGDPDAVTCRAPKSLARVCQTNRFWANLIKNHQTIDGPTVDNPRGGGDPDAVTCQTPKFVWFGPLIEVCQTNRFWADLAKNSQMVDADGAVVRGPPHHDYGFLYGPGENNGNWNNFGDRAAHGLSGDSGYASQSSANGGGGSAYGGYHP